MQRRYTCHYLHYPVNEQLLVELCYIRQHVSLFDPKPVQMDLTHSEISDYTKGYAHLLCHLVNNPLTTACNNFVSENHQQMVESLLTTTILHLPSSMQYWPLIHTCECDMLQYPYYTSRPNGRQHRVL
jgi:hypothetical protein